LGGFIFVGINLNLFGHIPGDFVYRDHDHIVIFPLASCLIFSLVVSAIFYLVKRNKR
jgi:hypothetical protein